MKPKLIRLEDLDVGIPAQMDYLMGPERDLAGGVVRSRYLICSTPRSGSTVLADTLGASGCAGDPLEYLNPRLMAGWLRRREDGNVMEFGDYLEQVEASRTSSNGVFGLKAHIDQLGRIWGGDHESLIAFVRRFDHFVFVRRRDKLAQAVSLYRARATQVWTSEDWRFLAEDDPRLRMAVPFNPHLITECLGMIASGDMAWLALFSSIGRKPLIVEYEAFVADMAGITRAVLTALGLQGSVLPPSPQLRKQGSEADPLLLKFRQYLGLDVRTGL